MLSFAAMFMEKLEVTLYRNNNEYESIINEMACIGPEWDYIHIQVR
jgi:hypothetical protein